MSRENPTPIPAFINPGAGSSETVRAVLEASGRFAVRVVAPGALQDAIRETAASGAPRILVSGGDGSIGCAADALAGSAVELAIVPGGTLNHFARDMGIPLDPAAAATLAAEGRARLVDLGWVNGRLFLNTSSVGAYVVFVRLRERLETRFSYRVATITAAVRLWGGLRPIRVDLGLGAEGVHRVYQTPLVFIGIGERELKLPMLGARVAGGERRLHVLVPRARTRGQLTALLFRTLFLGVESAGRGTELDSFLVDECHIAMRRRRGTVAIDGELVPMSAPLAYRVQRDALRVVAPDDAAGAGALVAIAEQS